MVKTENNTLVHKREKLYYLIKHPFLWVGYKMKKAYLAMLFFVFCNIGFAIELQYDNLGNTIESKDQSYVYDSFNRLQKVFLDNELLEEYFYDESGSRVKKVSYGDDVETTYYIDSNFIRVMNSSGTFDVVYYYNNGQQVAKKENDEMSFFHPDHLGSTTLITDPNGELVEETRYLPFGAVLVGGEEDLLYTGKEKDDTGLYYYEARYYDPFLRKFTQPDSIIPSVYNPQSLNKYSYVMNNPYKYIDPSGHSALSDIWNAVVTVHTGVQDTIDFLGDTLPISGDFSDAYAQVTGKTFFSQQELTPEELDFNAAIIMVPLLTGGQSRAAQKTIDGIGDGYSATKKAFNSGMDFVGDVIKKTKNKLNKALSSSYPLKISDPSDFGLGGPGTFIQTSEDTITRIRFDHPHANLDELHFNKEVYKLDDTGKVLKNADGKKIGEQSHLKTSEFNFMDLYEMWNK
jgi:RHS repeat-associated protein